MKSYTSKFLKSVALVYLTFPVAHIIAAGIAFDIPFNLCLRILLSPFYHFVAIFAMIVGYGLWEVRRWAWYLFLVVNVFIGYENALLVNDYGESHHKGVAFAVSVLLQIFIIYRVAAEIRVPYFFPKIRWWESNPRYRLSVPVAIARSAPPQEAAPILIDGEVLDISNGGCFIKLRGDIQKDEVVSLRFRVFGYPIDCKGTVVWRTQSTVTHPRGVGIKFMPLARLEKKNLRLITRRLKKIATLYRRGRYLMTPEDFNKQLEKIETSADKLDEKLNKAGQISTS